MPVPRPENIGDIYRVWGYSGVQAWRYGVTYKGHDLGRVDYWNWWLEMDDGDLYYWPEDEETPDLGADCIELFRRNPIPDWVESMEASKGG